MTMYEPFSWPKFDGASFLSAADNHNVVVFFCVPNVKGEM